MTREHSATLISGNDVQNRTHAQQIKTSEPLFATCEREDVKERGRGERIGAPVGSWAAAGSGLPRMPLRLRGSLPSGGRPAFPRRPR